jgi:hypothetical protein
MPLVLATPLLNPPLFPCLAGCRNMMLAARAYPALDARLAASGTLLRLLTPHTLQAALPEHVQRMGGGVRRKKALTPGLLSRFYFPLSAVRTRS